MYYFYYYYIRNCWGSTCVCLCVCVCVSVCVCVCVCMCVCLGGLGAREPMGGIWELLAWAGLQQPVKDTLIVIDTSSKGDKYGAIPCQNIVFVVVMCGFGLVWFPVSPHLPRPSQALVSCPRGLASPMGPLHQTHSFPKSHEKHMGSPFDDGSICNPKAFSRWSHHELSMNRRWSHHCKCYHRICTFSELQN